MSIRHQIFIRCHNCDRNWSEEIPSIQPASMPIRLRSIVCNCGADYQTLAHGKPTTNTATIEGPDKNNAT